MPRSDYSRAHPRATFRQAGHFYCLHLPACLTTNLQGKNLSWDHWAVSFSAQLRSRAQSSHPAWSPELQEISAASRSRGTRQTLKAPTSETGQPLSPKQQQRKAGTPAARNSRFLRDRQLWEGAGGSPGLKAEPLAPAQVRGRGWEAGTARPGRLLRSALLSPRPQRRCGRNEPGMRGMRHVQAGGERGGGRRLVDASVSRPGSSALPEPRRPESSGEARPLFPSPAWPARGCHPRPGLPGRHGLRPARTS